VSPVAKHFRDVGPVEVIVADGGSVDATRRLAASFANGDGMLVDPTKSRDVL